MASARAISTTCWSATDKLPHRHVERQVGAAQQFQRAGERARAGAARRTSPKRPLLLAEHDVFDHGQIRGQVQLLIDHGHAGRAGGVRTVRSVAAAGQFHLARVGRDRAAQESSSACSCRRRFRRSGPAPRRREPRARRRASARVAPKLLLTSDIRSSAVCHGDVDGRQSACSGSSSFLISGLFMFSGVAITSPVGIRFSTFSPRRCATSVLTL